MNKKALAALAGAAVMFSGAITVVPAYAQTAASTSANTTHGSSRIAAIIARSNTEVAARITSLDNLNTRLESLKNVSSTVKANLASEIQTNITGLTALQAKIDGETDITTLRSDEKSIFTTYRIYALVIPQGYIVAASDRVSVIGGLMTTVSGELQTRITHDQSAGDNVTALQAELSDLNTKIAAAEGQGQDANSGVASLVPDQGNATVIASNHAALVAARANIKTAGQDLVAARQDIKTIQQGLKGFETNATSTTQ